MFKKLAVLLMAAAFFCIGADAQANAWQKFKSVEGKFTATMPCKPEIEVKKADPEDKDDSDLIYTSCTIDTGYYLVSYSDLQDGSDTKLILDAYRDSLIEGSKLVSEKAISLGKAPGREVVLSQMIEESEMIFSWRFFVNGNRLYALAVTKVKSDAASKDVPKFLNSFAVTK